jgi:hypothetical protein
MRMVAGLVGLSGALFVLLGTVVPYLKFSTENVSIVSGYTGWPGSEAFWFSVEPFGVLVAAIVVAIMVMARPRGSMFAPGMLTAFGIQTILLFAGYLFTVYPPNTREAGAALGLLGGIALVVAGVLGLAEVKQRPADSQPADSQPASPAPVQSPPGVGPRPF